MSERIATLMGAIAAAYAAVEDSDAPDFWVSCKRERSGTWEAWIGAVGEIYVFPEGEVTAKGATLDEALHSLAGLVQTKSAERLARVRRPFDELVAACAAHRKEAPRG